MISKTTNTTSATTRRLWVLLSISLFAWAVALLFTLLAPSPTSRANDFFYDAFYRTRPQTDMTNSDVILVAADQASLTAVDKRFKFGWPWPRELWGNIATYAANSGARAVAFDLVFVDTSDFQKTTGDDDTFADALNSLKSPVIFGATANPPPDAPPTTAPATAPGTWEHFAPPVKNPTFGAVNVGNDKIYRRYQTTVNGLPSLALATVKAAGESPKIPSNAPFLLHYYGPHLRADGKTTFTFLPAAAVLGAQLDGPAGAKTYGISPEQFKNKIVILCTIAVGTYDLKSSPLSDEYPGPEVQATAIENLLRGDRVLPISAPLIALASLLAACFVSTGVVIPRRASIKLLAPIAITLVLFIAALHLFRANETIRWFPPLQPLLAILLATPCAFAWTYFAEDRQRRFMLKALSKVVSPAVAEQLSRDPERLARGTIRTDLTLLFTDLANFTSLSEGMDVQHLGEFMNRYLGEMSDQVLAQDGTLDKYIGDAIMCFWNAPLPQADHALRACRAALLMVSREREMQPEFAALGTHKVFTRIGINTASVAVGFVGSDHLFNYTAMGDGVNLASRLEGANKLYGTRILLSENTAKLVEQSFWLRKIDILRVKGKKEPMAVFELLSERTTTDTPPPQHLELIRRYEEAFAAYRTRNWDLAQQILLELSTRFGEDGPTAALVARVREYRQNPPEDGWDGVYISSSK